MKQSITTILAVLAANALFSEAMADDVSAKRVSGSTPDYPAACRSAMDDANTVHMVSVTYNVTRTGFPEDVRVRESTDPCFNDVAIASVRSSRFEPRRVDGKPTAQDDMETTFIFKVEEETESEDFDARPLVREPPDYPEKCIVRAANSEIVVAQFDITKEGTTENIRITESTNDCLNEEVIKTIEKWLYQPKTINGEPMPRPDVITHFKFVAAGRSDSPEDQIRQQVQRALLRAQRELEGGDTEKAFAELNRIEEKYGADFTRAELTAFHQLRGVARFQAGDYAGALDDFRIVQDTGVFDTDDSEALLETIEKLEMIVALQEQEAASAQSEEESNPAPAEE